MNKFQSYTQTVFYIVGIIFFIIIIVAAFIFMKRTVQTANYIKGIITSPDIENIITKIKDNVLPMIMRR